MKIAFLLTTADARAGTEKAITDQANALVARGHDVEFLSVYRVSGHGFPRDERITVRFLTEEAGPGTAPSLVIPRQWDNQFSADVDGIILQALSALDAQFLVTTTPALTTFALLAAPSDVRIVQQEHRATMARGVTAVPLLKQASRVDALVSLTQRNAEWIAENIEGAVPRLEVIPNALPNVVRPVSGLKQNVIMSAGRLVKGKGFSDLIRAFARAHEDNPGWTLRIFGDGPERDNLVRLTRAQGVDGHVEILPPTSDILTEWSRASIGALASRSEGLPLVVMEARGAGLPVVAYDCETGPSELLDNGVDGFVVELGNIQAFADSLSLLMSDSAMRARMGARGPESMLRFAPNAITDRWEQLYFDLLDSPVARFSAARGEVSVHHSGVSASVTQAPDHDSIPVARENVLLPNAREMTREYLERLTSDTQLTCRPLVADSGLEKWAFRAEDAAGLLESLTSACGPALEIRLYAGSARVDTPGQGLGRFANGVDLSTITRAYAFLHLAVEGTSLGVGYAAGIEIEFWSQHQDRPGVYVTPGRVNREFDTLLNHQFNAAPFSRWNNDAGLPLWDEVSQPIDVVYTWVDGSDPIWRKKKAAFTGATPAEDDLATGELRFRNRDELRYSLRSLHAYAPWVRKIYVVTDDQRPEWLVEDERLSVVSHRDLFPEPDTLPVFNSHAIESVLHRIPGLSEQFIYFNDDVFLMREVAPKRFFDSNGAAHFFPSPTKINDLGDESEPHLDAAMNNRALIAERFGRTITQSMLHTPHPHLVSVLKSLENTWPEAFERTRAARFRSPSDISVLSSLGQYAGYFEHRYRPGSLRVSFISLGTVDAELRLRKALSASMDILTFGEAQNDPDPERTQEVATNFLVRKFPVPSPWERSAPTAF